MPLLVYLWIAFAINYVDRQMVYSMYPALKADLGFAGAKLGLIAGVFMWVYTLSMPVAGRLADIARRDVMLVSSLVLWSVATFGCGMAGSESMFLFWRGVMGVTEALYYPAALAVLAGHYAEGARSRALGFHQSAMYAGVLIGGWYGGWAADNLGWRQGFRIAGGIGIAYSVVLWWGLRGTTAPVGEGGARPSGSVVALFRSVPFSALSAAFAAFCAVQWVLLAWYPLFLQETFRLSMTDSGWNATLFVQVCQVTGILGGGWLADRLRRRWPPARLWAAAAGVFLSAPFAYWTFASTTLNEARLFSAGFGLFSGLLAGNAFAAAYDITGAENRGLAGGVLNMTGGLSSAVTVYLAGALKDTLGFAGVTGWLMPLSLGSAVLLAVIAARALGLQQIQHPVNLPMGDVEVR
ncbi:MAG: MFS transporter [Acidobacteria bacterium]|nr:MFS transporter [Acidobacteriota bacterium]